MRDDEFRTIPLSQGKVAIVDTDDYERLAPFRWWAYRSRNSNTFYARRWGPGKAYVIHMHREILGLPSYAESGRIETDHRDGDGLNNRKLNLRRATSAQNRQNRRYRADNVSGYKGVSFYPHRPSSPNKWRAAIFTEGKQRTLGVYATPEEAHAAYIEAAKRLHGEFARW